MGSYTNTTIRDANGNIVGYQPVTQENPYVAGGVYTNYGGSAGYQAIVNQYNQQHYAGVDAGGSYQQSTYSSPSAQNPFNPNSAAGISWDVGKTGGYVNPDMQAAARAEGYGGDMRTPMRLNEYGETVVDSGRNMGVHNSSTPFGEMVTDEKTGRTTYREYPQYATPDKSLFNSPNDVGYNASNLPANYAYKEGGQIQLGNENGRELYTRVNPVSGQFETWGTIFGHSGVEQIGGGGAYAAQSGKLSLGKSNAGVVFNQDGSVNTGKSQSNYADIINRSGSGFYSDVGAEAYGGKGGVPTSVGYTVGSSPGKAGASTVGDATWWASALNAGEKNARTNTIETPMSFQNDGRGTLINQNPIGRYEKSDTSINLANLMYPQTMGTSYRKGDETPGYIGADLLKNYGTTPTNPGDVVKTEPKDTLQRVISGGHYDAESGRIFGNATEKNPNGYWDASLQVLPNPKYGQTVAAKERDTSGDLLPRDLSQRISGAQVREDQINAGLLPAPFRSNGVTAVPSSTPSGIEKVSGLAPDWNFRGGANDSTISGSKKVGGAATITPIAPEYNFTSITKIGSNPEQPLPFKSPDVVTTTKPSEDWVQGVPLIGGLLSAVDTTSREKLGIGIFAKTSEITQPGYSDFARGIAPVETTTITNTNSVVDRSSVKNRGAEWSAMFVGDDNKPTRQMDIPIKTTYTKDANQNTIATTEYESHDLSKVVLSTQDNSVVLGASPYQQKYNSALEGFQSHLPSKEVGERGMQYASLANPFMAPFAATSMITEKFNPAAKEQTQMVEGLVGMRGQYSNFYDDPAMSVGGFALGVGMGAGTRGVVEVAKIARVPLADAAIAHGGKYRSALQASDYVSDVVAKGAPYVFGGMYAADIGMRSTEGGVSYSSVGKAKSIFTQEGIPMGVGGMAGYYAPEIGAHAYRGTVKAWNDIPDTNRGLFDNNDAVLGRGRSRASGTRKNLDYPDSTYKVQSKEVTTPKTEIVEFTPKYQKLPPTWSPEAWNPELFNAGGIGGSGDGGTGAISRGFSGSGAKATPKPSTQSITTFETKTVQSLSKSPISESAISKSRVVTRTRSQSLAKEMTDSFAKPRAKSKSLYDVKDYDASVSETTSDAGVATKAAAKQKSKPTYDVRNYDSSTFESEVSPGVDVAVAPVEKSSARFTPSARSTAFSESTSTSKVNTISTARAGWMSISRAAGVSRGLLENRIIPDSVIRPDTGRKNVARPKEESRSSPYIFVSPMSGYITTPTTRGSSITTPITTPITRTVVTPQPKPPVVTPDPWIDTPTPRPPVIIIPPLGGSWIGGSSSGAGGGNRGRRSMREVIDIRSSLTEFFGPRPSQLTKRRGRNF